MIEIAPAYGVRNRVEAAYARSDLVDGRRVPTDDWVRYQAQGFGCPGQVIKKQALVLPTQKEATDSLHNRSLSKLTEGFQEISVSVQVMRPNYGISSGSGGRTSAINLLSLAPKVLKLIRASSKQTLFGPPM